MNWNFSAWSIRNPVPPILLFIVLMALGLMSFSKLPITRFPNIDVPLVSVTVTDPGVAPSELETQVTKRVEDAVANITGVKNVISTHHRGQLADAWSNSASRSTRRPPSTTSRTPSSASAPTCRRPPTSRSSTASTSRARRS